MILAAMVAALLTGCATSSPIGLVDVQRIVSNWDVYLRDQNQLLIDEGAIKGNAAQKAQQTAQLQKKYAAITEQLTQQIRDAAAKVAADKKLKLVVTRQGIGYGGVDITADVEKVLNITEKATPTPSP